MTRLSEFIAESRSKGQLRFPTFDIDLGSRSKNLQDETDIAELMTKLTERPSNIGLDWQESSGAAPASSGHVVVRINKPIPS